MASVVVSGDTSGAITLAAPSIAGTSTLTLPSGASGTIAAQGVSTNIVSGTAVSASSTSVDFTGIPSWVRRITVMFTEVSTNGSSNWLIQLGDSGGIENTGYISSGAFMGPGTGGTTYTAGFGLLIGSSTHVLSGSVVITNLNGNTFVAFGGVSGSGTAASYIYGTGGTKTLSATLDRIRITTVNGTDTFDAGTINILYE